MFEYFGVNRRGSVAVRSYLNVFLLAKCMSDAQDGCWAQWCSWCMDIVLHVWWRRQRHFPDLWIYQYIYRNVKGKCEMKAFESHPMNNWRFPILKLLKWKPCQYLQRLIRINVRTSVLCSDWLPSATCCGMPERAARQHKHYEWRGTHIGSSTVSYSSINLFDIPSPSWYSGDCLQPIYVNLWLSVLVVGFVQFIQLDMRLDRRPVYVISWRCKRKLQSSAR